MQSTSTKGTLRELLGIINKIDCANQINLCLILLNSFSCAASFLPIGVCFDNEVIQATTIGIGILKISMRISLFCKRRAIFNSNVSIFICSTNTGRFGQSTYHHHAYTPAASSSASGWSSGGGGGHKSKSSSLQTSALTLLAFLFFINMLHTCLKEQMTSLNPTVMVMTTGNGRIRKTGTNMVTMDGNKDAMNPPIQSGVGVIETSVADNIDNNDMITTNDRGDIFYGPAPKIALTLDRTFGIEASDKIWEEIKQQT